MSTTTDSTIRIQLEDFSVTDEIEAMKKVSRNIGGITTFLGTGRELSKGENITKLNFEHYPKMAEKKLEEIREKAIKDFGIIDMRARPSSLKCVNGLFIMPIVSQQPTTWEENLINQLIE